MTPNVRIYLAAGQTIDAYDPDLPEDEEKALEEIEARLKEGFKPHWCLFGTVHVFTQAIAAVDLA